MAAAGGDGAGFGRIDATQTAFASMADLASAMRARRWPTASTSSATGGEYDDELADWYAAYMVAEQAGTELPT